jgi:hypothetical protein
MRVRILTALSVVLLLSVAAATAAAARKQPFPASQQLCESVSLGGAFSTKANSSFFTPFYKKQGVLWTCNGYSGGATSSQELDQSCLSDGGQAWSADDSGVATCWKNPHL